MSITGNIGNSTLFSSVSTVRDVNFNVNMNTGTVVMRVMDANGALVKEIPSLASQKVDRNIEQMTALLFDLQA